MFCGTIHIWRKDLATGVPTVVQVAEECNVKERYQDASIAD